MEIAFVTPTLGRVPELTRLLSSLNNRLQEGDECVIVAQGNFEQVENLVSEFAEQGLPIRCVRSARGASLGRNIGVGATTNVNPLLVFPNDSNWYPEGTVEALRALPDSFTAGSMTMFDENGSRFVLPESGTKLDRWNVWRVLEATLLIRKHHFIANGGFDPQLGTGANSPWQAGEATDFLLRACVPSSESFEWLPPSIFVSGIPESTALEARQRRKKIRAYGRGIGHVISRYRYPLWWRLAFAFAGLLVGFRAQAYQPLDGLWAFIGRAEGISGHVIGSKTLTAVTK